ncbi:hypothetical protein PIB30_043250, partial [Stylosanthes scabra]|nr:hypothetical protein [Stylosanthes scabra]
PRSRTHTRRRRRRCRHSSCRCSAFFHSSHSFVISSCCSLLVFFSHYSSLRLLLLVSMFYLSKIEHTLPLPASELARPIREAIHTQLENLFLDKVIANLGLCVSVYDIKSIEGGFIYPGDGYPTYKVVFNLIMFRPFVGEIMTAKLLSSDADGLRLSLGFFDDIYVPLQHLPSPNEFKAESKNSTKGTWYWKYDEQSFPIDDSDVIKFRIQNVTYPSIPIEQPKESKPFAPMLVTGSIDHDGLGPVSWWPGQEQDAEEGEEAEEAVAEE